MEEIKMKTKLIGILTLSALLYACEGSDIDVIVEEEQKPVETVEKAVKKEVKKVEATVNDILEIYNNDLNGQFVVTYNEKEKCFIFLPVNQTFNKDLVDMMQERLPLDEWYKVVDGMRSLTLATTEKLGDGYGHAIMNPYNAENILLLIKDGTVLLDAFEGRE